MDNAKFTYYDIVSYIIPGAVVVLILLWFATGFLTFPLVIGRDVPDGVAVLSILVAGYFLGHVVHAIGARLLGDKGKLLQLCREYLQDKYPPDKKEVPHEVSHYSKEYKDELALVLDRTYLLQESSAKPADGEFLKTLDDRQLIELFHLSHALIREANIATNTDTLEAISNMYRGMFACAWVSAIICLLISLRQLLLISAQNNMLPNVIPGDPKPTQLSLGIVLTFLFIVAAFVLLRPRWRDYKGYFVDSLFTNLLIWDKTRQDENKPGGEVG